MISIIIPTYNRAELIGQTIESVLAQSYSDWELWVADDGSTDGTERVVQLFLRTGKVRYLSLPHSGLPGVARNAALRQAKGEFIAFLDSDDQWLPRKLERQIEILRKRPSVGLICSNAIVLGKDQDKPGRLYLQDERRRGDLVLRKLVKDNFVITSTVVIRHTLLDQVGAFSEDPLLRAVEDYDLWLRIAAMAEIYYVPEGLAIYRDDPEASIRAQQSRTSYWRGMLLILERLRRCLTDWGRTDLVPGSILDELTYSYQGALCNACWAEGRYLDFVWCWGQLLCQRPLQAPKLVCRRVASRAVHVLFNEGCGSGTAC